MCFCSKGAAFSPWLNTFKVVHRHTVFNITVFTALSAASTSKFIMLPSRICKRPDVVRQEIHCSLNLNFYRSEVYSVADVMNSKVYHNSLVRIYWVCVQDFIPFFYIQLFSVTCRIFTRSIQGLYKVYKTHFHLHACTKLYNECWIDVTCEGLQSQYTPMWNGGFHSTAVPTVTVTTK